MRAFGYTTETMQFMLMPLVSELRDPLGSMGNDAALACLSDKPRLLYDYFKQLFAQGQEFSYGLAEAGSYYNSYIKLMNHWEEVLPGKILRVNNEEVIQDLEGQVSRILNFLGLPFEEACISFHETDRSVRTASSEQVRIPINKEGVDRWKPYAKHLKPLVEVLDSKLLKQEDLELINK